MQNTPAKQTKSKTVSKTTGAPDAYTFDETDEFISGNSFLSTSYSPYNAHKMSRDVPFTKVVSKKKSNLTNALRGKKAKRDNLSKSVTMKRKGSVGKKVEEDKKKTSTPLLVESANGGSRANQATSQEKLRRSLRVSVTKLDLNFSVTPILPVDTPVSPKRRAKKDYDAKLDSYVAPPKCQATPNIPAEKTNCKKTLRQALLTPQASFPLALQDPSSVLPLQVTSTVPAVSEKKDLKRKYSKSNPPKSVESECRIPAKRRKDDRPKSKQSPKSLRQQGQMFEKLERKSSNKEVIPKQTRVSRSKGSLGKKSLRQYEPVASTQVISQEAELSGVWKPGKEKMYCTPHLYDSGISMGDDTGTSSRMEDSSTPSLPGFMEEEPLQWELQDFSLSPLSLPIAHSSVEPGKF